MSSSHETPNSSNADQKPKSKPISDDERGFIILTRAEAKARGLSGFHFQKTPAHAFAAGLSGAAHDVLGYLLTLANRAGFCRPVSYETIGTNVRRSRTTVIEAIKELEQKRFIQVVRDLAASRKSKKTNRYRILYEYEVVQASPKNRTSKPAKPSEKLDLKPSEKLDPISPKNRTELVRKTGPLLDEVLVLEEGTVLQASPLTPPKPSLARAGWLKN